jgi:hypothetical protein
MRSLIRSAAISLILTSAAQVHAGTLTENLTGFFGPNTTLAGVALGTDTAFTLQAVADTSSGITILPGLDTYAVTSLTIEIAGKGTFTGIPDADTNIFLADLNLDPFYQVGLVNSTISGGFGGAFLDATPGFDAAAPTSSILSSFDFATVMPPYAISLVGVTGGLLVEDIGSEAQTASIIVSVPEPSSLSLAVIGAAGLAFATRRGVLRRHAA